MNDSSQEPIFTITLDNTADSTTTEKLNTNDIVISNWDSSGISALTSADIITLTGGYGSGSITYNSMETIDLSKIETFTSFTNFYKDEFDGRFPDFERVQEMCKDYPGLEIAYRKFKEVYKMVKEDFDGKERERNSHK